MAARESYAAWQGQNLAELQVTGTHKADHRWAAAAQGQKWRFQRDRCVPYRLSWSCCIGIACRCGVAGALGCVARNGSITMGASVQTTLTLRVAPPKEWEFH